MRNGERERGAKRRVTKMRERDWWIEWAGLDVTIVSKRNKRSVGVERKDLGLEMDSRREISKLGAGNGREEKMSAGGRDYFVSEQKNEAQVFPNWIHVLQNYIIMCFFFNISLMVCLLESSRSLQNAPSSVFSRHQDSYVAKVKSTQPQQQEHSYSDFLCLLAIKLANSYPN